jgi:long-chain fatty acid transport protein
MTSGHNLRAILLAGGALINGAAMVSKAEAGSFGIREQSTYFTGDAYAGNAAGVDISSMYWNPAAAAALPGWNTSSSYYGIAVSGPEHATGGDLLAARLPASTDVGTDSFVTSSYMTYQYSDRLYLGLALDAPFGLITKPDNIPWAGSALGNTTRVFSLEVTPTAAYKITPDVTIGVGVQVEYLQVKLNRDAFIAAGTPLSPARYFEGDDMNAGVTAGVIWQPMTGTSLGIGYRSGINENPSGTYVRGLSVLPTTLPVFTGANAAVTLPDQVTASFRQIVAPQVTLLGTVEWTNWSRIGNVSATSTDCPAGVCETLNFNYRDGWYFSLGAEYAYDAQWTFRAGAGYEISPITDEVRDTLLPDSNRVHVSAGATYKWSDKLAINVAYSHIFFDNAPFCVANPLANAGTSHCVSGTTAEAVLLSGYADPSADIFSVGLNYKLSASEPLEPYKK